MTTVSTDKPWPQTFPTVTATATATATVAAPLPPQCNATNNYGIVTNGLWIEDGAYQANHYFEYSESSPGGCCARCFATTNCVAFAEFDDAIGGDLIECVIWEVYNWGTATSPTATQNPSCPLGTVTISLTDPTPGGDGGVGPCGVGVAPL